jgi:hypothetical protein
MSESVLVVHGVGNRDEAAFNAAVSDLNKRLGEQWKLFPVFWGDLGAATAGLKDIIPHPPLLGVRSAKMALPAEDELLLRTLFGASTAAMVRNDEAKVDDVVRGAKQSPAGAENLVRSGGSDEIEQGIRDAWSNVQWLKLIEDKAVLSEIGSSIATAATEIAGQPGAGGAATRVLGIDLKKVSEAITRAIDRSVGRVLGAVGGKVNQFLRTEVISGTTEFLGDVFVYQRHRAAIQQRLFDALAKNGLKATQDHPITVMAHSLGGIVSLDAALRPTDPLWIKTFITFGSQPAFFQVMDTREGLSPYTADRPAKLPATIGRWINFWEPMDLLAFLQGGVFELNSGTRPTDTPVQHLASSGLWTHSSYWTLPRFAELARQALANA